MTELVWPTRVTVLGSIGPVDPPVGGGGGGGAVTWTSGIQRHGTPARQILSPNSFINLPLPDDVLIDPVTPAVQQELLKEAGIGAKPLVATTQYSLPTFTVTASQPRVPIKIINVPGFMKAQQQILLDPGAPLPDEYVNQGNSDDSCLLYSPEQDLAWEFWRLRPITPEAYPFQMPDGSTQTFNVKWQCQSMWQITTVATHLGRSRNHNVGVYPNAPIDPTKRMFSENTNMSVAAARLPFLGTMLTQEDADRCLDGSGLLTGVEADHCLNLSVIYPNTARRWPASADDGFSATSPLQEGMRLRFDPTVYTVAHINSLNIHPVARLVAWFLTRRGVVVLDRSGALEIDAEPSIHDLFNGVAPSNVLNGFPWGDLQVIVEGSDANPNPT